MLITYYGHSQFLIETENGTRIFTDPCDNDIGYPAPASVDIATCSHGHHDHNAVSVFSTMPIALETAGEHSPARGVTITGIPSFHDDQEGALRGANLIFLIEADGLRLAHFGDLGHTLTAAQLEMLGHIDIAMIPVGGVYTVDGDAAYHVAKSLKPQVILPMHYRTAITSDWPISGLGPFLNHYEKEPVYMPLIRVTQGDLSCQPKIVLLDWPKESSI